MHKLLEKLEAKLEKFSLPFAHQNLTARRARFQASALEERAELEAKIKQLKALTLLVDSPLHEIRYMTTLDKIFGLARQCTYVLEGKGYWKNASIPELAKEAYNERLQQEGIRDANEMLSAAQFLVSFNKPVDQTQVKLKKKEAYLSRLKIPGFFPTPDTLIYKMLSYVELSTDVSVLEPSAGMGHIADKLKDINLTLIERDYNLREYLELKGYHLAANDIFQYSGTHDIILMNPPFDRMADIDHVRHCYDYCLASGGRLVSLMGESAFFRNTAKAHDFRAWFSECGFSERLPQGSFKSAWRSTEVNSRIIVLDK